MTASEFAFLALGLVLGVASGSALVVVLGSRPPTREVKVTVGHDAVPRRAATLSSDAFMAAAEPARGGPADRRLSDRDGPAEDSPALPFGGLGTPAGVPVIAPGTAFATSGRAASRADPIRTIVPSRPSPPIAGAPFRAGPADRSARGALSTSPGRDPLIDDLRVRAVLDAQRTQGPGGPTMTAVLESRAAATPVLSGATEAAPKPVAAPADPTPAIIRILRGNHRAMLRTVERLAGADEAMRRPWQAAVTGLAEATIHGAIDRGVLAFPVGNPFWDTFTTPQCRAIAGALAASGFRFDGIDGWADERVPTYRDLAAAVAAAGVDPRRVRAWPTQEEIVALYREVTVAADEYLMARAPRMDLAEAQEVAARRRDDLALLWSSWGFVREVLTGPI
jgi:hypothetical protein